MSRCDLRPLLAVAVVGLLVALTQTVAGLDTALLLLSPALAMLLPLLAGRYFGERRLARLVARFAPRRRRATSASPPPVRPRTLVLRGGSLLAGALADRAPPAA